MINLSSLNKGLVFHSRLSAENQKVGSEMTTNGTFTGSAAGWTLEAAWTYGSNKITSDGTTYDIAKQDISAVSGRTYRIQIVVSGYAGSALWVGIGDDNAGTPSADGTYTYDITYDGTGVDAGYIRISSSAGFIGSVESISVKELLIADLTPYGNHPQNFGVALDQVDRKGVANGAGDFNGAEYLALSDIAPFDDLSITDNYTFSTWININSIASENQLIVFRGATGDISISARILTTGELRFDIYDGTNNPIVDSSVLSISTWYHAVCVRNVSDDKLKIFIDGIADGEIADTTTANCTPTASTFKIGQWDASKYVNGIMGEVKLWNRALSATEVLAEYNSYKSNLVVS